VNLELSSAPPPIRNNPVAKSSVTRPLRSNRPTATASDNEKVFYIPAFVRAITALGASPLVVGGTAFVGIYAIRTAWGVHTIPDFSRRMRKELSTRFPGFTQMMEDSLSADITEDELDDPALDEWDYDSSKERLMKAFNEGGLSQLSEVAWQEMQMESRVLLRRRRREQSNSVNVT